MTFQSIPWTNIVLAAVICYVLAILYRWHRDPNNVFDALDFVMQDGHASLDKLVVLGFALLSGWVVVKHELDGNDVSALLLGILGIFILQRSATKAMDTFGPKPPTGSAPGRVDAPV